MSKKFLFNLVLPVFLFAVLFSATVAAQNDSCGVKMEVSRYNRDTLINGASATAVNFKTKKVSRSVLKDGQPYFANLPAGNYRVTVRKAGYMRSAQDFSIDCSDVNDEFPLSISIELYKGNPKSIVKLYQRPLETIGMEKVDIPPRRLNVATIVGDSNTVTSATDSELPARVDTNTSKTVAGGVVNSKSTNLVRPEYPQAARAVRASGAVNVQVTIDESGKVIRAEAISGHPLLRGAAEKAARESTFSPTTLSGQPVKVTGIIVYNFVSP